VTLYFFDLHIDNDVQRDEIGSRFDSLSEVRKAAQKLLPAVGYEELPLDGDNRLLAVIVTDESGRPVYSATLNYAGLWLQR
jgi:hypothetical protein